MPRLFIPECVEAVGWAHDITIDMGAKLGPQIPSYPLL
jgi:hypothetical protein